MSTKIRMCECTVVIPVAVQEKMSQPQDSVTFSFFNPTDLLVRLIALGPLGSRDENLALFPQEGPMLHDFCNGARMQRVHDTMPTGAAALTAVLFFDEINRDQKGFATGDGAIVVGGFFKQRVRESTYAKASLGTFPNVAFPKVLRLSTFVYVMFIIMFIITIICVIHHNDHHDDRHDTS